MNLLRKMVIGAANRYNQLMTYMQIFKTLNNSPPHPPSPKHKSEPTMVSAIPRNTPFNLQLTCFILRRAVQ